MALRGKKALDSSWKKAPQAALLKGGDTPYGALFAAAHEEHGSLEAGSPWWFSLPTSLILSGRPQLI